jgi:hypothetical protein
MTTCGKFVNISKIVLTCHFFMLTPTTKNIRDYVIASNAKTVTSVDRQNALIGHFDIQVRQAFTSHHTHNYHIGHLKNAE